MGARTKPVLVLSLWLLGCGAEESAIWCSHRERPLGDSVFESLLGDWDWCLEFKDGLQCRLHSDGTMDLLDNGTTRVHREAVHWSFDADTSVLALVDGGFFQDIIPPLLLVEITPSSASFERIGLGGSEFSTDWIRAQCHVP